MDRVDNLWFEIKSNMPRPLVYNYGIGISEVIQDVLIRKMKDMVYRKDNFGPGVANRIHDKVMRD